MGCDHTVACEASRVSVVAVIFNSDTTSGKHRRGEGELGTPTGTVGSNTPGQLRDSRVRIWNGCASCVPRPGSLSLSSSMRLWADVRDAAGGRTNGKESVIVALQYDCEYGRCAWKKARPKPRPASQFLDALDAAAVLVEHRPFDIIARPGE